MIPANNKLRPSTQLEAELAFIAAQAREANFQLPFCCSIANGDRRIDVRLDSAGRDRGEDPWAWFVVSIRGLDLLRVRYEWSGVTPVVVAYNSIGIRTRGEALFMIFDEMT